MGYNLNNDSLGMPSNEEINKGFANAAKAFVEAGFSLEEFGKVLNRVFEAVVIPCGAVSRMDKRQKRRYKRLAQNG